MRISLFSFQFYLLVNYTSKVAGDKLVSLTMLTPLLLDIDSEYSYFAQHLLRVPNAMFCCLRPTKQHAVDPIIDSLLLPNISFALELALLIKQCRKQKKVHSIR
jgi:hypothetical protein